MSDDSTLRLVRGDAGPEELAALLAVLAARAGSTAAGRPAAQGAGRWGAPEAALRHPPAAGPGAWRASGLPH